MPGSHYYLLSALPALTAPTQTPPVSREECLAAVEDAGGPTEAVRAVFLADDLIQRQSYLAGQVDTVAPAVLSEQQMAGEAPLPDYLDADADPDTQAAAAEDTLWATYFRWAHELARTTGSAFLAEYVAWEVALRNALAQARAEALGLDPNAYLVATELAEATDDFAALLSEWSTASDPLDADLRLDTARWTWLGEHEAYFSFSDDELIAYAARLTLLTRRDRISRPEETTEAPGDETEGNQP